MRFRVAAMMVARPRSALARAAKQVDLCDCEKHNKGKDLKSRELQSQDM